MQRELDIIHTEGDVDVLIRGVVRSLDGGDVLEDTLEHVVDHRVAQVLAHEHDVVNEQALDILGVVIGVSGDDGLGVVRILLDELVAALAVNGDDDHVILHAQVHHGGVGQAGGDEHGVALAVLHVVDGFTVGEVVGLDVIIGDAVSVEDHAGVDLHAGVRRADAHALAAQVFHGLDARALDGDELDVVGPQAHQRAQVAGLALALIGAGAGVGLHDGVLHGDSDLGVAV